MRFIVPIILILISVASFLVYTEPTYQQIKILQTESAQYNTALTNAEKLQEERDTLSAKYHSISPDSLTRLSELLPDNADDIRLIIDIQNMAQSYGMTLSDIKFDATDTSGDTSSDTLAAATPGSVATATEPYGVFNLEFSTDATYPNFLSFIKDLESSLRLTDIQSIDFTTQSDPTKTTTTYTIKLTTYWLKG